MNDEEIKTDDGLEVVEEREDGMSDPQKKITKLRDELKVCEQEKREHLEGWQRTKADLVNYKRDEAKRLEDLGRFITAGVLQDLLPVLDSFELALQSFKLSAMGATGGGHEQGVLMIRSQMLDVLKKRGVRAIEVVPGEPFNPERHESLGEIESEQASGTIAEEVQRGYTLGERVIRPARVRIVK
ncbi:MAG: nucleotide exchange factor GrpE [bacterium]|nr:nucleotide exchange factor GrpE [bacterium]MDZ4299339.1 nucleotide exchange factor GrpE [Candidatus Sungbacteria bacterium]